MGRKERVCDRHIVLTGAKSRSHLIYVAAYIRSVLEGPDVDVVKVSFVEAGSFLSAPPVTLEDLAALLSDDPRLDLESGMPGNSFDPGAVAEYVSVGAPGIGMLLKLVRANPGRRFAVVVTDEGIGTYGSASTRRSALRRQGVGVVVSVLKAGVVTGVAKLSTSIRWAAYRREGHEWSVNPAIAEEFRRHISDAVPGTANRAVVLTQPFADLGLISDEVHLAYVDAMCSAAGAAGLDVVIRPHPAEDVTKYGARPLMDSRGTAELDPAVVESALVLGGPSTALINVSAMYGSRVLWVSIPGLEHLDAAVSRRQAGIFAAFLGAPVQVVAVGDAVAKALAEPAGTR